MTVSPYRKWAQALALRLADLTHRSFADLEAKLLLVGLVGLPMLWYVVPGDSWLFHADLVPWVAVSLCVVLGLRADRLGPHGHPQLRPLTSTRGIVGLRTASASVPLLLMALDEVAARVATACPTAWTPLVTAVVPPLPMALAFGAVIAAGAWVGRDEGRTAWRPVVQGKTRATMAVGSMWVVAAAGQVILAAGEGGPIEWIQGEPSPARTAWLAGASFLLASSLWDRFQSAAQEEILHRRWQARPAGRRTFARVLAATVPAIGVAAISRLAQGPPASETGQVASALDGSGIEPLATIVLPFYLASVATALWRRRPVIGLMAVLHEVVPVGEAEPSRPGAPGDTSPPRGTLRFHPDRVTRTGLALPWPVPRRAALADPPLLGRESLWSEEPAPPLRHVLGEAYLEEPGWLQLRRVRIDTAGGDDVLPLGRGDNQERRLVIYSRRAAGDTKSRTWRWERASRGVTHVDPSTRNIVLHHGDIILVASGMVTQLYEVELGDAIREGDLPFTDALPRFQDEVGT